ncbi:hypothetical protein [Micromonospora craniellae]|uniref:hypothetical protein n=1 Tax=Micromonospora craniellae TaxID=2294034 RepID=UPI0011C14598|nr:hypothetical protein [Micromonospora craniellae]
MTGLVNRHGLPVITAPTTGGDPRWQVTGPDGHIRWSTPTFTPALFTAAGDHMSGPVARAESVPLSEWLGQPDWPTAERYLRDNIADLLHPQTTQELRRLGEQDPHNRLIPAYQAILDLTHAAGGVIDPPETRYQPTETIRTSQMEPRDTVQGPMPVTFALDYLTPRLKTDEHNPTTLIPDRKLRRLWDDRLLRLTYHDTRARDLAATLAAGVIGEHQGRVDDGRWNATMFGAVATVLRMTVDEARTPGFIDAWNTALDDIACCTAHSEHRMHWVPRLDELRFTVTNHGIPGNINEPAPDHATPLNILTDTMADCRPRHTPGRVP